MQGKKKLTEFENERIRLRQKIDKAQRKKLKLKKGTQTARRTTAMKDIKYLPYVAFDAAEGDPLRALTAAVDAIKVAELIK